MSESLPNQALELVHQTPGRDRDDVPTEREQPAGKGIVAAYPEAAVIGVTGHRFAQPLGRGGCTGLAAEADHRLARIAGAELPGLARAGMLSQIEAGGDLVV